MPLPAVFGLKGHSIIFSTGTEMPAEALFLEQRDAGGGSSPEVFPRGDGTTYVCGLSSQSPLPVNPAEVAPDPGAIEKLQKILHRSLAGSRAESGPRPAGLLPAGNEGRAPAPRVRQRREGRLRGNRPQRLGYPQRAGDRRGDGRADPERRRNVR